MTTIAKRRSLRGPKVSLSPGVRRPGAPGNGRLRALPVKNKPTYKTTPMKSVASVGPVVRSYKDPIR